MSISIDFDCDANNFTCKKKKKKRIHNATITVDIRVTPTTASGEFMTVQQAKNRTTRKEGDVGKCKDCDCTEESCCQ